MREIYYAKYEEVSHLLEELCIKYSFLDENKREEYLSCAKS